MRVVAGLALLLGVLTGFGLSLAGCGLSLFRIEGEPRGVQARGEGGSARVELLEIHGGKLLVLRVLNEGPGVLTINRHNFLLRGPDDVYLSRLSKLRKGDELELDASEALWSNGKPLDRAKTIHVLADD